MYNAKESKVNISSGPLTCISFGRGDKPLVMVPGLRITEMHGAAGRLAWYYRIFAKDYSVYMFDNADNLPEEVNIHDLAEDLCEAMDASEIAEAYVFGASQGGMIAQDLAINHPDKVKALVLGVTASRSNGTIEENIREWIDMAGRDDYMAIARDYLFKGYSEEYIKKYKYMLPLAIKTQKMMPKERFMKLARACLTVNTFDDLDKLKCPVLVLGGGKDKIVTGEASREIAGKLGCECHIYEDLSHEAYNEAKDFNQRIFEFFAEC